MNREGRILGCSSRKKVILADPGVEAIENFEERFIMLDVKDVLKDRDKDNLNILS